jgi:hypothetical protein
MVPFFMSGMVAAIGISSEIIYAKVIDYLQKYYDLINKKNSSEQLQLLLQARKSVSSYTSPVEAKVLNDLIWLHNFITVRCSEMIKGKTPIEQVIELKKYLDQILDWSKSSILSQHSWFARQYYHVSDIMYIHRTSGKTAHFDKWFDKSFVDGFIREIIKKYNLKTCYTAADGIRRCKQGIALPKIDVKYIL